MKLEKGITLIALLITVTVMLIIVSVSISTGIDALNSTRLKGFYTQLEIVQKRVDDIAATDEYYIENGEIIYLKNLGSDLDGEQIRKLDEIINSLGGNSQEFEGGEFRYFTSEQIKDILGIPNIDYDLFIDFDRRIIISEQGITIGDDTYYVLESAMYFVQKGENEASNDIDLSIEVSKIGKESYKLSIKPIHNIEGIQETKIIKYKEVFTKYWEKSNKLEIIIEDKKFPKYYDIKYEYTDNMNVKKIVKKSYGIYLDDEDGEKIAKVAEVIKIESADDLIKIPEQTQVLAMNKEKDNLNIKTTKLLGDIVTITQTDFIPEIKNYATDNTSEENKFVKIYLLMNNITFTPTQLGSPIEYWKPIGDITIADNGRFDGNNKEINVNYVDSKDNQPYTITYNKTNMYKEPEYEFNIIPMFKNDQSILNKATLYVNGEVTEKQGQQKIKIKRAAGETNLKIEIDDAISISYVQEQENGINIPKIENPANISSYDIDIYMIYRKINLTIKAYSEYYGGNEIVDVSLSLKNNNTGETLTGTTGTPISLIAGMQYTGKAIKDKYEDSNLEITINSKEKEQNQSIKIEPIMVKFTINPIPSDATVIINGKQTKSVEVPQGSQVEWSVSKLHYYEENKKENINSDTQIEVKLNPIMVTFTVNPTPSDAKVIINDVETKTVTVQEGSSISYSVSKQYYNTYGNSNYIVNKTETQKIELTPKMVTFTINPTPSDATVKINGTTAKSVTLQEGSSINYEVSKAHYITKTGTTTALDTTLSVALDPIMVTFAINPTPSDATVKINGTTTKSASVQEGSSVSWEVSRTHYTTKTGTSTASNTTIAVALDPIMVKLTVKATGHSDATIKIFNSGGSVVAQGSGEVSATVMEGSSLKYTIEKKYYQKITSSYFDVNSSTVKEHSLTMNKIINTVAFGPSNAVGDNSDIKNISYACSRPYADNNRANSGTATNRTVTYTFSGFNLPADALVQGIFFRSRHGTSSNVINTDMHFTLKISGSANYTIFDEENDSDSMGDDTGRWRYVTTARKCMARFYVWRK